MARPDKAAAVAELTDEFRSSNGAVLTEYRGLTVAQLRQLRTALGDDVNYAVVKNTLTKIAAKDAGVESFDALLEGPSAIAFIKGDPVVAAKGLRDFAKANPLLVIKAGVLEGKALGSDEINKLADLESREVLLAKLAGAMKAAPQQAVSLFAAPLSQAARLFAALQDKLPAADATAPWRTRRRPCRTRSRHLPRRAPRRPPRPRAEETSSATPPSVITKHHP